MGSTWCRPARSRGCDVGIRRRPRIWGSSGWKPLAREADGARLRVDPDGQLRQGHVGWTCDDCGSVRRVEGRPVTGAEEETRSRVELDRAAGVGTDGVERYDLASGQLHQDPGVTRLRVLEGKRAALARKGRDGADDRSIRRSRRPGARSGATRAGAGARRGRSIEPDHAGALTEERRTGTPEDRQDQRPKAEDGP